MGVKDGKGCGCCSGGLGQAQVRETSHDGIEWVRGIGRLETKKRDRPLRGGAASVTHGLVLTWVRCASAFNPSIAFSTRPALTGLSTPGFEGFRIDP